jgi:hypothetical protein
MTDSTFQDLGLAKFGSGRCAHCGNPTGLRQFKSRDGSVHIAHLGCAAAFFATMEASPPVAGEKIDQPGKPAPEAPAP